jgi:iron complex transport system substrate-binding protein
MNNVQSVRMRGRKHSRVMSTAVLGVTALSMMLSACGTSGPSASSNSSSSAGSSSTAARITVTNCGKKVSYDHRADRIVATSNSANIGTLMKIGAVDDLAAVSLKKGNDAVMTALYGPGIEKVQRLDSPISMESIVATSPNLLIGSYSGLFAGASGVTQETAAQKGIPTYVISDSCRQDPSAGASSKLGTMGPWDAVRTDLANYGELTGHQKQAAAARTELDGQLDALEKAPKAKAKPKVLLFDSGTDQLYTSGHNGPPQGIIDAAGGENVFASQDTTWFKASWESVAQTKPDVIVVMDYRQGDPNEVANKVATINKQAALTKLDVVKKNRIIVLPLALFTSGYPNIEAAVQLRLGMEKLGLEPASGLKGTLPASMGYGVYHAAK